MAEIANPNQSCYHVDSAEVTARNAEYTGTPLTDTGAGTLADPRLGCNDAGSCAPGIGVNTGDYSPKDSDWPEIEQVVDSDIIGGVPSGLNTRDPVFGITALVGFAPPDPIAPVLDDDSINIDVAGSGFASFNRTGKTIPSTAWTWGAINNP